MRRTAWYPVAVVVLTLLAYAPALRAGFIWDDDAYLTGNATLRMPDALRRIWFSPRESPQYYPVVFTALYVERALWGMNPAGYHAVNVLLHAGSAIVLWLVLRRLKMPGAMVAGLVFAVHPVAAESVAWVTELKNTLAGIFALGAVYVYLPFGLVEGEGKRAWGRYGGALGLFVLAMLSKTVACGVGPVLLLILWWRRERLGWRDVWPLIPFFVMGAGMGWNTARLEVDHVGATGADFTLNAGDRVLMAGRATWFYAAKDVWPAHLAFFYERWGLDVRVWWQWLYPAGAAGVIGGLLAARRRIGKGPAAAALAFVALLFPALGFVDFFPMMFSFVADHFQYLALMVFAAGAGALAARATARWAMGVRVSAAGAVVLVLAFMTSGVAARYADPWTLWSTLAAENRHWMGLQGMSGLLLQEAADRRRGGAPAADVRPLVMRALVLNEQVEQQRPGRGDLRNNDAEGYLLLDDVTRAEAEAREAVSLSPGLAIVHQTLAKVLEAKGDGAGAGAELRRAMEVEPWRPQPHSAMGQLLFKAGDDAGAEREMAAAAELGPAAITWEALGYVRSVRGNLAGAREAYRRALVMDDSWAPALDGLARAAAVDAASTPAELEEALSDAEKACELSAQAMRFDTLGMVRWRLGDRAGALAAASEAARRARPEERELIARHAQLYAGPVGK